MKSMCSLVDAHADKYAHAWTNRHTHINADALQQKLGKQPVTEAVAEAAIA